MRALTGMIGTSDQSCWLAEAREILLLLLLNTTLLLKFQQHKRRVLLAGQTLLLALWLIMMLAMQTGLQSVFGLQRCDQ